MSDLGTSGRAKISRLLSTVLPSSSTPGSVRASEPVARMMWVASTSVVFPSFSTATLPGPAQKPVLLDDNLLQPQLRGADGGYVPAGPAADDGEIVFRQAPLLPSGRHNSGFLQDLGSNREAPALSAAPRRCTEKKQRDEQKLDSNSRSRPPQPRPAPGIALLTSHSPEA